MAGRAGEADRSAGAGSAASRGTRAPATPDVPDDVDIRELPREVAGELRTLSALNTERVAGHLVMAGRLLDEQPEAAYQHAVAARATAGRVPSVREAVALTAYAIGRYAEALAELRTVRRMTGSHEHLPLMADCERGLGRPERALAMASAPEAARLDDAGEIEMRIVTAGARRDLGQLDAAVLTLQVPQLRASKPAPWLARLRYAYADALLSAGRRDEAREWFQRAAEVDLEQQTDATERINEIDGVQFLDVHDLEADELGPPGDATEGVERADVASPSAAERRGEEPSPTGSEAAPADRPVTVHGLFIEPAPPADRAE